MLKVKDLNIGYSQNGKVKEILKGFVRNPITVSVKKQETAENIEQEVIRVGPYQKIDKLHDLLKNPSFEDSIIVLDRLNLVLDTLLSFFPRQIDRLNINLDRGGRGIDQGL